MERHINSSIIWNTWRNESNFSTRKTVKPITIDKDCLNSCLGIDHRPSYWTKCIVHQCKVVPTLLAPEIIDETHPQTENNLSCRPITQFKSSPTTQGFLPTRHLRLHKSIFGTINERRKKRLPLNHGDFTKNYLMRAMDNFYLNCILIPIETGLQ